MPSVLHSVSGVLFVCISIELVKRLLVYSVEVYGKFYCRTSTSRCVKVVEPIGKHMRRRADAQRTHELPDYNVNYRKLQSMLNMENANRTPSGLRV